jgi:hypothetical protein
MCQVSWLPLFSIPRLTIVFRHFWLPYASLVVAEVINLGTVRDERRLVDPAV